MTRRSELGKQGEDMATQFLRRNGYKIIDRNYWERWGEIDIIALSRDGVLVFVEVKTVRGPQPYIDAEEQVTSAKLQKLQRTANLYANEHEELITQGWRIDLVAITVVGDEARVRHYENI